MHDRMEERGTSSRELNQIHYSHSNRAKMQNAREVRSFFDGMRLLQWPAHSLDTTRQCMLRCIQHQANTNFYRYIFCGHCSGCWLLLPYFIPHAIIGFVLKIFYVFFSSMHTWIKIGWLRRSREVRVCVCVLSFYTDAFLLMTWHSISVRRECKTNFRCGLFLAVFDFFPFHFIPFGFTRHFQPCLSVLKCIGYGIYFTKMAEHTVSVLWAAVPLSYIYDQCHNRLTASPLNRFDYEMEFIW